MTDSTTANTQIQFPPIPLVSGRSFHAEDGTEHDASAISVVIRSENGQAVEVPLDFRFGGWWAPVG